jgi:hypothetical protein
MNMKGHLATRHTKYKGLRAPLAIFAIVLLGLSFSFSFWIVFSSFHPEIPQPATVSSSSAPLPFHWEDKDADGTLADTSSVRPIYPYSVIPRGVISSHELQAAIKNDSVVSSHYSDFNVHSAHIIRLAKERQAFVSYRLGDRIFWTKKKVTMRAGETLLTDGMHLARTRCGNRISDVPVAPTSPTEPTDKTMNPPFVPQRPELTTESLPIDPIWTDFPPPVVFPSGNGPHPPSGPGTPFLPLFPVLYCCGSSVGPSQPPAAPPVVTPEPSAMVLLITGLATILVFEKLRRS